MNKSENSAENEFSQQKMELVVDEKTTLAQKFEAVKKRPPAKPKDLLATSPHQYQEYVQEELILFNDEAQPQSYIDDYYVIKSNEISYSQTSMTARQQKLFAALISLINPMTVAKYEELPSSTTEDGKAVIKRRLVTSIGVTIDIKRLALMIDAQPSAIDLIIEDLLEVLHKKPLRLATPNVGEILVINIAKRSYYNDKTGQVTVEFHEDIVPHLIDLKQYNSYRLVEYIYLQSKYGGMLFDFISAAYNTKKGGTQIINVPLDSLYFALELIPERHKDLKPILYNGAYKEINRCCIKPAIEDVNRNTRFELEAKSYRKAKSRQIGGFNIKISLKAYTNEQLIRAALKHPAQKMKKVLDYLNVPEQLEKSLSNRYGAERFQNNAIYFLRLLDGGFTPNSNSSFLRYLTRFNIAEMPDFANPYPIGLEGGSASVLLRSFKSEILSKIWWQLDEEFRFYLLNVDFPSIELVPLEAIQTTYQQFGVWFNQARPAMNGMELSTFINMGKLVDSWNDSFREASAAGRL